MSNIIKFPRRDDPASPEAAPTAIPLDRGFCARGEKVFAGLVRGLVGLVWLATVLIWPLLKWVLSLEVFFQFLRMVYYWNTPGVYAGWTFVLHFAVLTSITYFVAMHQPKGFSR